MIRFIVLLAIGYFLYRAVKNWMLGPGTGRGGQTSPEVVDDEMVKDPVCEVYVARRTGVRLVHEGREYVFCSDACRDRFLESRETPDRSNPEPD